MRKIVLFLAIGVIIASCSNGPEPINYGKDACEHCKMTIMDTRFGTEIITAKGRVFKFDAIECMVGYIKENPAGMDNPDAQFLTVNIASPGNLIDARTAFFLKDKAFRSPMGGNLSSFNLKQLAENNLQSPDGEILTWNELLNSK